MKASVVIAHGARAVEQRLLVQVLSACSPGPGPRALEQPLRVIVPSRSLREHLCAELVRESKRALVAVTVHTLYAAAREILAREGAPEPADHLLPVLVRRHARAEPQLSRALDDLQDGYAIAVATVRDLLDAGLDAARARSGARALADDSARGERARALLRVAEHTRESLGEHGLTWTGEILSTAAARLHKRGPAALPARAVFVHGFAEATGRASELIETIARVHGASVYIDHPPHPLHPERDDPGVAFTARLRARLAGAASLEEPTDAHASPRLWLVRAPGATAELRQVARRIAALLEDGVQAESIGVVTRALDAYALPLRQQFARLGVPFSGVDARGPPGAAGRRLHALADLLRRGEDTPVDRWLDALGWLPELGSHRAPEPRRNPLRQDLSLALHALGAGRLRDVAELDLAARLPGRGAVVLPVRRGLVAPDDEDGEESVRAERRRLPRAVLEAAIARARALRGRLASWHSQRSAEQHLGELRALLDQELGWTESVPASVPGRAIVQALARSTPPALELAFDDFTGLVQRQVAEHDRAPIGGRGAGVQVLDVTEARGRTFSHLFLIGMNREVFPRTISEDPLLPDELRTRLARVLPELSVKATGHDEESYLYAQLLSSSPCVTLSWQYTDDEGQARSASSLVEHQLLSQPGLEPYTAPALWTPDPAAPRPAHEHAVLYALAGAEPAAEAMMELAFEAASPSRLVHAADLVRARTAVRREYDAGGPRTRGLGPYFGFLGPVRERADARRADLYVTTLERYAVCPWQTLLLRLLRLETTPDALDALPSLDPRLVGSAVHAALEQIAAGARDRSGQRDLAALAHAAPVFVRWPDDAALDAILRDAARGVLQAEGVDLPGLARALAERTRGYLDAAREHVFEGGSASLLGAEVAGALALGDEGAPTLHFRVDLVERHDGRLRLTDYKTGRPISKAATGSKRHEHLLGRIASGQALQAAVYRLGAGANAEGRYLFLEPGLEPEHSEFAIRPEDDDLDAAFRTTLATLLSGVEQGVFFPRLLDATLGKSPPACRWCDVAEACLQGDSGARRRLARFAERQRSKGDAEAVLLDVWSLGRETGA